MVIIKPVSYLFHVLYDFIHTRLRTLFPLLKKYFYHSCDSVNEKKFYDWCDSLRICDIQNITWEVFIYSVDAQKIYVLLRGEDLLASLSFWAPLTFCVGRACSIHFKKIFCCTSFLGREGLQSSGLVSHLLLPLFLNWPVLWFLWLSRHVKLMICPWYDSYLMSSSVAMFSLRGVAKRFFAPGPQIKKKSTLIVPGADSSGVFCGLSSDCRIYSHWKLAKRLHLPVQL